QPPAPDKVGGSFWLVGGSNTGTSLQAYEQIYGQLDPKKISGNLFLFFLGNYAPVAPKLIGSYFGGFGTFHRGGLKTKQAATYVAQASKWYPGVWDVNDGFFYNYWNAGWALVQGLQKSGGEVGPELQRALPRTISPPFQVANKGVLKLDSRRQAIQDQYPLQIIKGKDGKPAAG